jgi:hypothetical protein
MKSKTETIKNFLNKAGHYKVLPALIKNSPCDHNAKVCQKEGYVKLVKSTQTGNTYQITPKGHKYIKENLPEQKSKIFKLMEM